MPVCAARAVALTLWLGFPLPAAAQIIQNDPGRLLHTPPVLSPVPIPAALSRAELAQRLKRIDGSLPNVPVTGAAVVVGPGHLAAGRTTLDLFAPEHVTVAHGTPIAVFSSRANLAYAAVEFDAPAGSRFVLDFVITGDGAPAPGGSFTMRAAYLGTPEPLATTTTTAAADGHQLFSVTAPRAGRVRVTLLRGSDTGRWRLVRVEILRLT